MGAVSISGFLLGNITGVLPLLIASGKATGNAVCATPSSGKKLRIYYLAYQPLTQMEVWFNFGVSATKILYTRPVADGIVAKDFGEARYIQGNTDEALNLNVQLGAVTTYWNVFYIEVGADGSL